MSKLPYNVGDVVRFRLKAEYSSTVELIDDYGNTTYVTYLKGQLKKNQQVDCQVTQIKNGRPIVKPIGLVKDSGNKWSVSKERILEMLGTEPSQVNGFISLLLSDFPILEFENEIHRWITQLAQQNAPLAHLRSVISDFLEYSEFLNDCKPEERMVFTERITLVIELIGYYIRATQLLAEADGERGADKFVTDIFRKLDVSGYVYHPRKNIYMLICLFSLDKQLMQRSIARFLEIIRKREMTFWQKESYYQVFTKVLELYVNETDGSIDKRLEQTELLSLLVQTLGLMILLHDGSGDKDEFNIQRSRLLRYASYLNPAGENKLLDMAWHNLLDCADRPCYNSHQTADAKMLSIILANNEATAKLDEQRIKSFIKRNVKLTVKPDGSLALQTSHAGAGCRKVLADGLLPWHNINIGLPDSLAHEVGAGCSDIFRFRQMWAEIELALFSGMGQVEKQPQTRRITELEEGDEVCIYMTHQDKLDKNVFHCRIVDGPAAGAKGCIHIHLDVVGYRPNLTYSHFLSKNGQPLVFPAWVKKVEEDGSYLFTMRKITDNYQVDAINYDTHLICSVGSFSWELNRYSAVSKEGFSVSFPHEPNMPRLKPYDVVEVNEVKGSIMNYYLDARFVTEREEDFTIQDAFHSLMLAVSDGEYVDLTEQEDVETDDSQEAELTAQQVYEIMRLIDRKAVSESDYIRSYNYLGIAKILATMLGNEERIRFYKGRMDLLVMLHDFAVNDRVDEERLVQLEQDNGELFRNNVQMNRRFHQLKLVGCIGKENSNGLLWSTINDNKDESLKNLASLVLSHNLLKQQNMEHQSREIHAHIKNVLHLKVKESGLKDYGVEDIHTEFKTSLVYPAAEKMVPNLAVQTGVILDVIASMLNTEGGTIYLGVNDSGAGFGLEEDLKYPEFSHDRDKYIRYITSAVCRTFGSLVAPCVKVFFDQEANRPVCVISITPYPNGVEREGRWLVRQNTQKITYSAAEYKRYRQLYRKAVAPVEVEALDEKVDETAMEAVPEKKNTAPAKHVRTVPTAVCRYKNQGERYDGLGYVNLMDGGGYMYSDTLMGGMQFTHEIYPEDELLVILYTNGRMNVVPVSEITDKNTYREYIGVKGSELAFAALARKEDNIFLKYMVKGKEHIRVIPLAEWPEMVMSDTGKEFTVDPVDEMTDFEIIPKSQSHGFRLTRGATANGCPTSHKDGERILKLRDQLR